MSTVVLREYERVRKSSAELKKTEYELNVLEKRFNDKSKWNMRADKANLIKEVFSKAEINNKNLTPSVDQWLELKRQRNERKTTRSFSRASFEK